MTVVARNAELGAFLRVRRSRLTPADVALDVDGGPRRVKGLRREEMARLIGISPDYYTRLEQGRQRSASPSVLDAVARAMCLTPEERDHLHVLAGTAGTAAADHRSGGFRSATADRGVSLLVEAVGDTPAMVCDPFLDVLLANEAACFLFADFSRMPRPERNGLWWMLLAPEAGELYGDQWQQAAGEMIGMLRLGVGRHPDDPRGAELVAALGERSELFSRLWFEHHVSQWHTGEKVLSHPRAGRMTFFNSHVAATGDTEQMLYVMTPEDAPGFAASLASWREETAAR